MAKRVSKKKAAGENKAASGIDTRAFLHDRFGMFIHWGVYSLGGKHEWHKKRQSMTDADYQKYVDHFDPDLYDPRKWARAARTAGMKYFAITTKHHDGFCMWDTKQTDYKVTNTPYGKDTLREMVDAFREEGLRVCFYYSLLDWHHPEYPLDQMHPLCGHPSEAEEKKKPRDIAKYRKYLHAQVKELMTQYGKIDMVWFDFSFAGACGYADKDKDSWGAEKLVKMVRRLQPGIMINNRTGLDCEPDFVTPEQYQPEQCPTNAKGQKQLWEGCQTFSGSWGYSRDEESWKSTRTLLWLLIDSVSKDGNLLLNVGPNARGELDARTMDRLEGIGRWMRVHSRSIYGCGASEFTPPPNCCYTQNGKRLYLHFFNWPIRNVLLPGLAGKIAYAQFLNDASEIHVAEGDFKQLQTEGMVFDKKNVRLDIPAKAPDPDVPVIELFLK